MKNAQPPQKIFKALLVLSALGALANLRGSWSNIAWASVNLALTTGLGLWFYRWTERMAESAEQKSKKLGELAQSSRFISYNASIAAARSSGPGRDFETLARELDRFSESCQQAATGEHVPASPPPFINRGKTSLRAVS